MELVFKRSGLSIPIFASYCLRKQVERLQNERASLLSSFRVSPVLFIFNFVLLQLVARCSRPQGEDLCVFGSSPLQLFPCVTTGLGRCGFMFMYYSRELFWYTQLMRVSLTEADSYGMLDGMARSDLDGCTGLHEMSSWKDFICLQGSSSIIVALWWVIIHAVVWGNGTSKGTIFVLWKAHRKNIFTQLHNYTFFPGFVFQLYRKVIAWQTV